jgi:hypothetical protein
VPSGVAAEKLGLVASKLVISLAKLGASLLVLRAGFSAVSDDDYARTVIAQRFAEAPSLDPSGTSWLPLPFWLYGSAFAGFADDLRVARVVALGFGIQAALSVWLAARWLGANRAGALCAGLLAALFPWSVWLGAAPLPEAPAAGLVVLGMAALAAEMPERRLVGGAALAAACFCRYEAWPVALAFAAITVRDARSTRETRLLFASAFLAIAPIGAWLLHGAVRHGDALFFWKRVAGYRAALGGGPPLFERLSSLPVALVREEPGLLLLLLLLFPAWRAAWPRYRRPLSAALALIAFLLAGELAGGGPTHHAARALLSVWYLGAVIAGDILGARLVNASGRSLGWLAAPAAALALSWWAHGAVPRHFPDRSSALDIGARAKALGAPGLFIDTPDYSHLAVTAAFGRPRASVALDDHDPRKPRSPALFASETRLRAALAGAPESWLVASRAHAAMAGRIGRMRAENTDYVLIEPSR